MIPCGDFSLLNHAADGEDDEEVGSQEQEQSPAPTFSAKVR